MQLRGTVCARDGVQLRGTACARDGMQLRGTACARDGVQLSSGVEELHSVCKSLGSIPSKHFNKKMKGCNLLANRRYLQPEMAPVCVCQMACIR